MRRRKKTMVIVAVFVTALATGLAIAGPELRYRADRASIARDLSAMIDGPNPLDEEFLPVTFGEPLAISYTAPVTPRTAALVNGATVTFASEFAIEPPDAISASLMISSDRVKVIIMPSALAATNASEPIPPPGLERIKSHLGEYLTRTTRVQFARDLYRSSLARLAAAQSLQDRYQTLYLYTMRSLFVVPVARDRAVEIDSGKVRGFLFGRLPGSAFVDAEVAPDDAGPLYTFRFTDKGGATDDDVLAFLAGLTISPAAR